MMIFPQLSDHDFQRFRKIVYDEAGINLNDLKKALLQARLMRRMRILGLASYTDYYDYLIDRFEEEKIYFINAVTTNKTDFFRESRHFDFIKDVALPHFEKMGKSEIKVWSAGCSTGEEPYTLAITLLEYFKEPRKVRLKILATDIDTQVLEEAKAGIYKEELLRDVRIDLLKKYFYKGKGDNAGFFKVKDCLRGVITFARLNLLDEIYPMKGLFDMIFCRNVIIYFDKDTQSRLFKKFNRYLSDYGYLFIGHSENISSVSKDFELIGNTIYKKASL